MLIYFGADHKGFELKEHLKKYVNDLGYETYDVGNDSYDEKDDYTDFAAAVGQGVGRDSADARGVLICGSGAGMVVTVNKFQGVRGSLAVNADQVYDARREDDINVLCIASNFTDEKQAEEMVKNMLQTEFDDQEKRVRRLNKITEIEEQNFVPRY